MDCYLASGWRTDRLLERLSRAFQKRGESYSIIYLSDHAVEFKRDGDSVVTVRDPQSQKQYEVPFIELGDTVKESVMAIGMRSSMRFTSYFPTWIGVATNATPAGWEPFTAPGEALFVVDQDRRLKRYDALKPGLAIQNHWGR